jgi:hypothetical protein
MTPKSLNFLVNEIIQRHPLLYNGLFIHVSETTHSSTEEVKYLGMHLDRRLTWKKHLFMKRKQLGIKLRSLYWMIGRNSKLSLNNKLLLYIAILTPVWTYGIQLWGSAANSNLEILERFPSKVL